MMNLFSPQRARVLSPGLARFAWIILIYTLLVILWGAYVRATGSGAGCGSHWPTCGGEVIPRSPQAETVIEFTHRLTSAVLGPLGLVLIIWSWRVYGRRHPVTRGSLWVFALILVEGALGAGLVLFELVADNSSTARALAMGAHLVNTLFLLTAMTLTAWWAAGGRPLALKAQPKVARMLAIGLVGLLVVGALGAVTALGDTLFPADSFAAGAAAKFEPGAHFSVRARLWHPTVAVGVSIYLLTILWSLPVFQENPVRRFFTRLSIGLILLQLLGGVVNVLLAAPVAMQLVHLLLADLTWIALVLLGAAVLEQQPDTLQVQTAQALHSANGRTVKAAEPKIRSGG